VPDAVERSFHLVDERDHGVEQKKESDRAEHVDVHTLHELHHLQRDLGTLIAERCEKIRQHGLDVAVEAEEAEDGECDRQSGYDGEQCRVDEAHCTQAERAAEKVAHHRPADPGREKERPLPERQFGQRAVPDESVGAFQKCVGSEHELMLAARCCFGQLQGAIAKRPSTGEGGGP